MWAATSEVSGKHVGEGVKIVDGVWGKGSEPFKGRTFEGGGKSVTEEGIVGCIKGDVGYVYFKVLVKVGLSRIVVQCEGFPLNMERCVSDGVNERVATPGWLGWQRVWCNGMVDEGREGSGEIMRWDMGGGKGGNRGRCCGVPWDGGMMNVYVMGRDDGCLLSGGEGIHSGVVLTFFLTRLVRWGLGGF